MLKGALLGAAFAALLSTNALADPMPADADLDCLIVGLRMGGEQDATAQRAGLMMSVFYVGRIQGAAPQLDLGDAIYTKAQTMTPDLYRAETTRCGQEMQSVGQNLVSVGNRLHERAEATH